MQILTTLPDSGIFFDINVTTPIDVANRIKTNETYGISIGNYSEGRLEYQPVVNITDMQQVLNTWTDMDPSHLNARSYNSPDDWIWGTTPVANRKAKLILVSIPFSAAPLTNGSTVPKVNAQMSGFGFLNTDVLNAAASSHGSESLWAASNKLSASKFALLTTAILLFTALH
ncbi:hypothetical protein DFQ28_002508 [Apophysomyces sp. BC1034]|nr:hypothetical protein DFQ28_002508 [Apophysomyces sp. BC1034]